MPVRAVDYANLTDIELAQRAAGRDPNAIRLITTRNNQRLFRTAWSVLRAHTDAEDVVQETYLKAFTSISRFTGQSSLSTWLTRIAINTALDRQRAAQRRRAALEASDVSILADQRAVAEANHLPSQNPESALARRQLAESLRQAVASLPDQYRSIFVLREIEGLSVRDTSLITGLEEATVKTRLFRARRLLRKQLTNQLTDALHDTLPFAGADCEAMTARVLSALNLTNKGA